MLSHSSSMDEDLPVAASNWKTTAMVWRNVALERDRLCVVGNTLCLVRYLDDFPVFPLTNIWDRHARRLSAHKIYVVQTGPKSLSGAC